MYKRLSLSWNADETTISDIYAVYVNDNWHNVVFAHNWKWDERY